MSNFKDEYILDALSKIRRKKYELYVVSKVLFTLNDPDIEFVCQQYIKTPKGRNFVDLYFPQFQIYLKVNELYHASDLQRKKDQHRDLEILETANLIPYELSVYDYDTKLTLSLKAIDAKITEFCDFIRSRKTQLLTEGKFEPWLLDGYDPRRYMAATKIRVSDNVIVRRQHEALQLFGAHYKGWQPAWWKYDDMHAVWFPKLYKRKNSEWDNHLSNDGKTIVEKKTDGKAVPLTSESELKRIVFAHHKNNFGKTVYKFIGVFQMSRAESTPYKHVHKLIADEQPIVQSVV